MTGDKKSYSDTNKEQLCRLRTQSLDEVCTQFEWSRPVSSFITPRATFQTVLQSLINHQYWFDAAMLLSHAMPQREAVWWSARICTDYLDFCSIEGTAREEEERVLVCARRWVREPEEEHRMAAYTASSGIPNRLPAHWVGMAVFWATGNITPDAGVVTPPPPYLYARGVSAAIDLAASLTILARDEFYEAALGRGVDVASGGDGATVAKMRIAH
jgi:hypothetical protein